MTQHQHEAIYKGVRIWDNGTKDFPFSGSGIVYDFRSARDLFDYIDKALASGKQSVNENHSLMFNGN